MVLATHALVGAVIGKNIQNPWIIAIVSLMFHYVLDMIRHGEYVDTMESTNAFRNAFWKVALDFSFGLTLVLFIIYFKHFDNATSRNIFIGMFFSMLPDSFTLIYWKTHWKSLEKLYKFHAWIHHLPRSAPERQWDMRNARNDLIISILAIIAMILG